MIVMSLIFPCTMDLLVKMNHTMIEKPSPLSYILMQVFEKTESVFIYSIPDNLLLWHYRIPKAN